MSLRRTSHLELVIILGALTAFAPLAIDMYLPSLPTLERAFAASTAEVQRTLASFFLGFALGQALYGPAADRFGRKPPLYAGLALFALASLACALAQSVEALTALRFFQAVGACSGAVIARAMVRDLFEPQETARIYSALMLVMGVAPILAPLLGGYLLLWFGWEAIFGLLTALALLSLAAVAFRLPETHDKAHIRPLALGDVLARYAGLLADRHFMGYALSGGMNAAGMFAYIAGSPFVFIELYRVAPEHYGWIFGSNAAGLILASQINGRIVHRFGADRILRFGNLLQTVAAWALVATAATGGGGLLGIAIPLFVYVGCVGIVSPNAIALAMAPQGAQAGSASALVGTLQFSIAALAATAVGAIHQTSALPMAIIIAICGTLGLILHRWLIGGIKSPPAA
ncbi:MAG TPA: Bcr/CflA family multidrug efflux MFS transporter [Hypericibacter adhaerens]|jgi:DHA1 family bicyclomycin/chloramphenicol resistance-like MFS transporter|uniref:Bcr/CflA family efflux transporter n=1 Tax=Hypericibacter adhaerens TaxID=2602016 RepID=A0A5J6N0S6_9PROT|nr:Bcr/CflA family multidrug efflux MFS transporter [Hypericibacter adhaerens]QEX23077.1 Bcr/CflA family drug resistance efflux transporter [Hypericibacter adhaerens]HWA45468.1 Bcr/CflA family multidrug efflux MFS transporter [Hypericibacter adhaerens]